MYFFLYVLIFYCAVRYVFNYLCISFCVISYFFSILISLAIENVFM